LPLVSYHATAAVGPKTLLTAQHEQLGSQAMPLGVACTVGAGVMNVCSGAALPCMQWA